MEVEEGEMGEDDTPAPWYEGFTFPFSVNRCRYISTHFALFACIRFSIMPFFFQFHPNRLQSIQKVLDSARLL